MWQLQGCWGKRESHQQSRICKKGAAALAICVKRELGKLSKKCSSSKQQPNQYVRKSSVCIQ